VVLME